MFLYLMNSEIQKILIVRDPWYFLWVIWHTLVLKHNFLVQSAISMLGWLDTPLPPYIFFGFLLVVGIVIVKTSDTMRKDSNFLLYLSVTGVIVLTFFGLMLHFYVQGTAVASPYVDSIQGRYLLPILPFFLYALSGWVTLGRKYKALFFCCLGFLYIISFGSTIFYRYYDYSRVFDVDTSLRDQEVALQGGSAMSTIYIQKPVHFLYSVKTPLNKIGGFQFLVAADEKNPTTVPYQFEIKDALCEHTIRKGYLDLTELHRPHVYSHMFAITPLENNAVCFVFTPLYESDDMQYLKLVTDGEKPIVHFLYIKK